MSMRKKLLVLGVDGMDPSLANRFLDEGCMPNLKTFIQAGSSSVGLKLMGGVPTITPPMWTSLATGANPSTHGITDFWGQSKTDMAGFEFNITSARCHAEQMWNVTAEAGMKTLVWHWPGSSWPPSSDSDNLHVVDGVQPSSVGYGDCLIDDDKMIYADPANETVVYDPKMVDTSGAGCVLSDVPEDDTPTQNENINLILSHEEGDLSADKLPYDKVYSPLRMPKGWELTLPDNALELTCLLYGGAIRRPALVLADDSGKYHRVEIYRTKHDAAPMAVLEKDRFYTDVLDEVVIEGKSIKTNRHMKLMDLDEETGKCRIYFGGAMDIGKDDLWHPRYLKTKINENVGPVPATSMVDASEEGLVNTVLLPTFEHYVDWQAKALEYLIEAEQYDVVFSHLHNVDTFGHLFWYFAKPREGLGNDATLYQNAMKKAYIDTDRYLGHFLPLLEDDWTILLVSDHGLLTPPEDTIPLLGDGFGCNIRVLEDLGYTVLKKDAEGNELREIDYSKTRAVANRGNHIYLNIKGREPQGIVDPAEKYELERQIIDDLYSYRQDGKRVVSLAVRNKEAAIFGLNGDESGDIIYWLEEGFNRLHGDSLPTFEGMYMTSVSPIFAAAGVGVKKNFVTTRVIRTIDVTPTIATILGLRMPAECEGAPAYQILNV